MATLSVLKFNDPGGATGSSSPYRACKRHDYNLEDVAVVRWPLGDKKPKTQQLHSTAGGGATWGAFWGFLFGLIFFVPFLGRRSGRHGCLTDRWRTSG